MKTINKIFGFAVLALVVLIQIPQVAFAANSYSGGTSSRTLSTTTFNTASNDCPTVAVGNFTTKAGIVDPCWPNSNISAQAGEIVNIRIYYHNTGGATATNTRIRLSPNPTGSGATTFKSFSGSVVSNNAPTVSSNVSVSLTSAQTLTFGSVQWKPNQSKTPTPFPNGQTGAEIFSSNGLYLGDIASGWTTQGSLSISFVVGNQSQNPQTQTPSMTTGSAGSVTSTSAVLSGSFSSSASNNQVWFEYGTTPSFGTVTPQMSRSSSSSFNYTISNLSPDTTYYFRSVGRNSAGTTYGTTQSFRTNQTPVSGSIPTMSTSGASNIGQNNATLSGFYNANGSNTLTWFEYGTTASFGTLTSQVSQGSGSGSFSQNVSGLFPNTTYYFRSVGQNSLGISYGTTQSFQTTGNGNPVQTLSVSTGGVSQITATSATLSGTYNSSGSAAYAFAYGPDYLDNPIGTTPIVYRSGSGTLSQTITGLQPDTVYDYVLIAQDSNGNVAQGGVLSFTTSSSGVVNPTAGAPYVSTSSATSIGNTSVMLNGYVDSNGSSTTRYFQWGTSSNVLLSSTSSVNQGITSSGVSETLLRLSPNTTYYFRTVATNSYGTNYGAVLSFTTLGSGVVVPPTNGTPTTLTTIATSVGSTNARLNGVVYSNGSNTNSWFEYGTTTTLGTITSQKSLGIVSQFNSSADISGLASDTIYYYRAIAQNAAGTTQGDIVIFKTLKIGAAPVTTVVVNNSSTGTGTSSLVALKVDTKYTTVSVGDISDYTVTYKNISGQTLKDSVLQVKIPKEMEFKKTTAGSFLKSDNTITLDIGQLVPNQEGTLTFQISVLATAKGKDMLPVSAVLSYTRANGAQEQALAYSLTKVGDGTGSNGNNLLGASIFGDGSFLPTTLLGWLVLALIIFGLIILGRNYYAAKPAEEKKTV